MEQNAPEYQVNSDQERIITLLANNLAKGAIQAAALLVRIETLTAELEAARGVKNADPN